MRPDGPETPSFDSQIPEVVLSVVRAGNPERLALMLYGSVARGTSDADSDVDILELVISNPTHYRIGSANVTQYLPAHLHSLAQQGSLFVLHLQRDGVILEDESGVLTEALSSYVAPKNYSSVWEQLRIASGVVDPDATDIQTYMDGAGRLGVYIARTAIYLRTVEAGQPNFDLHYLVQPEQQQELAQVLGMRRKSLFKQADLLLIRRQLQALIPDLPKNTLGSIEAYAVSHANRADLASLFTAVLSGTAEIDYSNLTLPPF